MKHQRLKIGFNTRLLCDPSIRGWNRYALSLIRGLAETGHVELSLLTDHPMAAEHRRNLEEFFANGRIREIASGPMFYPKWQEFWLPRVIRRHKIQAFHTPYHFGLPIRASCPTVATIHDAIDASNPLSKKDWRNPKALISRYYLWQTRAISNAIITVSQFSAVELEQLLRIRPHRLHVIHEAADLHFHEQPSPEQIAAMHKSYGIGNRPYVFYVGGLEERKNFAFVIFAMYLSQNSTSFELVLAGGSPAERDRLRECAESLDVGDRVRFLGKVPDADLPALYAGALGLIYPSIREGFGLQLVEAMAVGCPVLASRATSLPEVLGDGGQLFSPNNVLELLQLLERLEHDHEWRAGLAARSKNRGTHFSWTKTAELTVEVYRKLIHRPKI